jgi:hypothetical protein
VGPCFNCGGNKASGRFELKVDSNVWVCAACSEGGDTISLVQKALGKSFVDAAEWLGGTASAAPIVIAAKPTAPDDNAFRERERRRLWHAYRSALPGEGSPIEAYFEIRAIDADLAKFAQLRFAPSFAYFHGEEPDPDAAKPDATRPRIIHVGPAMLAPILRPDNRFGGLHITWLDLGKRKGKAEIFDAETGEMLPAKKVRGSKKGGRIELIRVPQPRQLFAGEGIETVGYVWTCYRKLVRLPPGAAWWTGVDRGNLAGRAAPDDRLRHPTKKTKAGRAATVPGRTPDLSEPAMPVPASVDRLVWLADGDSDRFETSIYMDRAVIRNARPGLTQIVAWPPDGFDFNDMGMS